MQSLWIVAFFLFDVIATAAVLLWIIRRRGGVAGWIGFDPKQAASLSHDLEQDAEQFLRSNWSGDPTSLPAAFEALLQRFEQRLAAEHMPLERSRLKPLVLQIVESKHLAGSREAREAMKHVA